ncbi:MAG TPA: c-type cytochrome [Gammaproteobacteria bacterium]|nr:c-type cytochrome [Gammaproteobacteria bacterium]
MSEQEDRTFIKTFIGVIIALIGLTIALILLATYTGSPTESETTERVALERSRAEERLQPVGAVRLSGEPMPAALQAQAPAAAAEAAPRSAEQIVQSVCSSCHGSGVLGAPKIGDKAAWEERMKQGLDTVVGYAINGLRAMPPRGGDASLSDEQVREAVLYMLKESGISAE